MPRSTGAEEWRGADLQSEEHQQDEVPPPIGTTFVLSLYFVLLVVMWLLMYFGLLSRR